MGQIQDKARSIPSTSLNSPIDLHPLTAVEDMTDYITLTR